MPLPLSMRDPLLFPIVGCRVMGQIAAVSESLLVFGDFLIQRGQQIPWDHTHFCSATFRRPCNISFPGSGRVLVRVKVALIVSALFTQIVKSRKRKSWLGGSKFTILSILGLGLY